MKLRSTVAAVTALMWPAVVWGGESLTLDECIKIAVKKSGDVRAVEIGAEIARHDRDAIFWRFFPSMKTGFNYIGVNYVPANGPITVPIPDLKLPITLPSAVSAAIKLPDQLRLFDVMAVQPITQLWQIANGYKAKDVAAEIEVIRRVLTEEQLAAKTAEYFYSYLMLARVEETLDEAQKQLARYKEQAQSFIDADMTDTRPLLKIQMEGSKIEKERAATRGGLVTVKAALAALMDRKRGDFTLVPEEPDGLCGLGEEELLDLQQSHRHELRLLEKRDLALKYARYAAVQPFIPSLSVMAGYMYNWDAGVRSNSVSISMSGQTLAASMDADAIMPKGMFFFGGMLSWEIGFDWARGYHEYRKAAAEAEKSRAEADESRRNMQVQAIKLYSDLQVKSREIEIAKTEVTAAAENLRIEEEKYGQTMTTETNLLDAHLQLRQAKTALIAARYQYRIAVHQIAAVTGVPVEKILGK